MKGEYVTFKKFIQEYNSKPKLWYHGDTRLVTSFRDNRMDRDLTLNQDRLANGPGIYFTEQYSEALDYARPNGYVYTVHLKGTIIPENTTLTNDIISSLIFWAIEEIDDIFVEEDEIQDDIKKYTLYGRDNFLPPTIAIYDKYYGNDNANIFTNNLVTLGIDGIQVTFSDRQHVVVYNPKIIDIIESKDYAIAYEDYYNEEE